MDVDDDSLRGGSRTSGFGCVVDEADLDCLNFISGFMGAVLRWMGGPSILDDDDGGRCFGASGPCGNGPCCRDARAPTVLGWTAVVIVGVRRGRSGGYGCRWCGHCSG